MNFGVSSENDSEKENNAPGRRYPQRSVAHRNYTEEDVPNDDDYICKCILLYHHHHHHHFNNLVYLVLCMYPTNNFVID
jgi:hypothetical protein